MAKLRGVELKKMTEFKGHEGEPLVQGDVYWNGKKVGFYSQDAHGGEDNMDVPAKMIEEFKFYGTRSYTHEGKEHLLRGLQWLFADLIELNMNEKTFNTAIRKHYRGVAIADVSDWEQRVVFIGSVLYDLTKADKQGIADGIRSQIPSLVGKPMKVFLEKEDFVLDDIAKIMK